MGLRAMIVIEIKTRLIEIGKEIDHLLQTIEQMDVEHKALLMPSVNELQSRHKDLEADHDLLRLFDESEWGGFSKQLEMELHKLSHDVGTVQAMTEQEMVPA